MTAALALMILVLIVEAVVHWFLLLSKRKPLTMHEAPYVATAWREDFSGAVHGGD